MRIRTVVTILSVAAPAFLWPAAGRAQERPPINIFMDCQAHDCDTAHFRTEIGFVNWMRDRTDADVHVLITSEETGGGGSKYSLTFIGQRDFARDTLQLGFSTPQTSTSAERRDMLTNRIAQGLLHYAVNTTGMERVSVRMRTEQDDGEGSTKLAPGMRDPWNQWVFSINLEGDTDGESRQSSRGLEFGLSAERVTEKWKIEMEGDGSYQEDHFELEEGPLTVIRRNYSVYSQVTKALAPLWSAGLQTTFGTSTFRNQKFYGRVAPVLEYSFVPYSEFARRRITLQYSAGANLYRYEEVTLFDRMEETVFDEELALIARFQQPWGSAGWHFSGSHYFHDLSRYELFGEVFTSVRLLKGLSFEADASYSRVHNQLFIRKGTASDEDVLTERRALATAYEYGASIGLRYTFGSIYNNIVNRRID